MASLIPFNKNRNDLKTTGFDDFYNMLDNFFEDTWAPMRGLQCDTFKLDVQENDKEYSIEAELPGVKKDEIKLEINENKFTISVEKNEKTDERNKNYIHRERRSCSMQRNIFLKDAKPDDIKAKLKDGVLIVTVPKDERKTASKSITIE